MVPNRCLALATIGWLTAFRAIVPMSAGEPPNIVFIMADDLGTGHPGFNGQTKIKTPHIDRLRAQGRYFSQAYAGCAVCAPSRSVLMTGYRVIGTS